MLLQIHAALKELTELRRLGLRAEYDDIKKVYVKLADLSSKYY